MRIDISLRRKKIEDLELFFRFQLVEEAQNLATFMSKDPADKDAYLENKTA